MRLRRSTSLLFLLIAISHMTARPIHALAFTESTLKTGKTILYVHDCGRPADDRKNCNEWESIVSGLKQDKNGNQLYAGDAWVLDKLLSKKEKTGKPYDEIWLFSGGGNLNEGIAAAKVLRQHHATVRVIKGAYCISSCTVIFMGGYFRYVDDGASYRVHSGSSVMEGTAEDPEKSPAAELIADVSKDPDRAFSDFAADEQAGQRQLARTLQRLFQNTLLIPFSMHLPDNDADFKLWAESNKPHLAYTDPGNPRRAADVQRYKAEGPACIQDIAMRIERDAMAHAIEDVRAILPTLGKRAEPALDMVSAMYMTSIKETSDLSQETMLRMGYITEDNILQQ